MPRYQTRGFVGIGSSSQSKASSLFYSQASCQLQQQMSFCRILNGARFRKSTLFFIFIFYLFIYFFIFFFFGAIGALPICNVTLFLLTFILLSVIHYKVITKIERNIQSKIFNQKYFFLNIYLELPSLFSVACA